MGSAGGGGGVNTGVVKAEETVTPAVAKSVAQDTESAIAAQQESRARLKGIRSTYTRFANEGNSSSGANGSAKKLG